MDYDEPSPTTPSASNASYLDLPSPYHTLTDDLIAAVVKSEVQQGTQQQRWWKSSFPFSTVRGQSLLQDTDNGVHLYQAQPNEEQRQRKRMIKVTMRWLGLLGVGVLVIGLVVLGAKALLVLRVRAVVPGMGNVETIMRRAG